MNISKGAKSNDIIDLIKFIMSVLIVAMHTQLFGGIIYPVTRLAVPVFFIISSYLFFKKDITLAGNERNNHFLHFVKRNLKLYLFWFVVLLPLTIYIGKYYEMNFVSALLKMLKNFLFGSTFQASWYITAGVIGMMLVFFLSKKLNNFSLLIIGVFFYAFACLSSSYIFIITHNETLHSIYSFVKDITGLACRNFIVSIIYIVLGKIIAQQDYDKKSKNKDIFFGIFSFILLVSECVLIEKSGVVVYDNDCYIFLVPVAYFIVKLCVNTDVVVSNAPVLRKMSTVVYCAHMPIFMVVGKLISLSGVNDNLNILKFMATIFLTWIGSFILFKLEKIKCFSFLKYSH